MIWFVIGCIGGCTATLAFLFMAARVGDPSEVTPRDLEKSQGSGKQDPSCSEVP